MNLFRAHAPHLDAARRIKAWAAARFGAEGDDVWLVTEAICRLSNEAPRQTVIALLHPAANLSFRLAKPMEEITQDDILNLGDASAALAAEACC